MSTDEIWIIGTDPPCPRCDYLTRMAVDLVNEFALPNPVRHIAYTDPEAIRYAAPLGLTPGTAKDVAKRAQTGVDWDKVYALIEAPPMPDIGGTAAGCCSGPAAKWSPALDDALRPCQEKAGEVGIMMTPALVIAGRLIHQGSVPPKYIVRREILKAFSADSRPDDDRIILEVLGSGCKKCDTLYSNVVLALDLLEKRDCFHVRKRTDIRYFQDMGVNLTPGLVLNGRLVAQGKVLTPEQIGNQLEALLGKENSGIGPIPCAPWKAGS